MFLKNNKGSKTCCYIIFMVTFSMLYTFSLVTEEAVVTCETFALYNIAQV